ncbi:MAG TPA: hypothetical protein VKT82_24730 [Ktedonobacterales bacterium]|nr:hypothetical protein [Ktedonobacterales bacterium]
MSAALGATFPATYFVDHQGQPVTPGTFWADFNSQKGTYTLLLGEAGG